MQIGKGMPAVEVARVLLPGNHANGADYLLPESLRTEADLPKTTDESTTLPLAKAVNFGKRGQLSQEIGKNAQASAFEAADARNARLQDHL
jgi:hypothetical protein